MQYSWSEQRPHTLAGHLPQADHQEDGTPLYLLSALERNHTIYPYAALTVDSLIRKYPSPQGLAATREFPDTA